MKWLFIVLVLIVALAVGLRLWRQADMRADRETEALLIELAGASGGVFDPAVIADLPAPAQRYFRYTISPGARLFTVVELEMTGELGTGDKAEPNYQKMRARQVLAPPHGLVWRVSTGPIEGSDGATPQTSWTRFWLFGLLPVVRVGDDADHHRSAFGRVVAEGAFWAPASLLPGEYVRWEGVDADTARAIVAYGDFEQTVDITVAGDGRPTRVVIARWSNENEAREFRLQPFGGFLSDFREVDGYRLPTRVEGGNHIGGADYFPFYKADVTSVEFPQGRL